MTEDSGSRDSGFVAKIRVRYGETDRGGVVYHANYLPYFDIARTEWLRHHGVSYRDVEDQHGILLTVTDAQLRYRRPILFDDQIEVTVRLTEMAGARIRFEYALRRAGEDELLCSGSTTLASVKGETGRPCRLPDFLREPFERALLGDG